MKIVIVTLVIILWVPVWSVRATSWNKTNHLFLIERNKNKNVVHYDVQLMENNDLREPSPVVVYWVLENGRQEKLNLIQRKYAYGIDSQDKLEKNKFRILLVALKDREIIVERIDGFYKAAVFIGGKHSILEKVYVKSKEGFIGMPKVLHIDLFGRDIQTNLPIKEWIHHSLQKSSTLGSEKEEVTKESEISLRTKLGGADTEATTIYARAYNQDNESSDFQGPLTRMYQKPANNGKEVLGA